MELGHPDHWRFFKRIVDDYRSRGYHIHIHGSPPCQALSNASTRNPEEGMPLVLWYLDLVEKCEPDSWSMENVVPVRKKLPEGTPSVVLNSADFGVPQTRRRCYAGEGWSACPSHTKEEWVSVIEALPHLEGDLMDSGRASAKTTGVNPATGKKEGGSGPLFRELSDPSYTVMSSPRDVLLDTAEKPVKIRSLTLPETLVLQGFNPDYDLSAARTMKSRWTMVGNAVPPPVAEAVIRGIENAAPN
jgi:site-specific DNA-cytosine methylase